MAGVLVSLQVEINEDRHQFLCLKKEEQNKKSDHKTKQRSQDLSVESFRSMNCRACSLCAITQAK